MLSLVKLRPEMRPQPIIHDTRMCDCEDRRRKDDPWSQNIQSEGSKLNLRERRSLEGYMSLNTEVKLFSFW